MENTTQPPGVGTRREPSTDPVKAQGILYGFVSKYPTSLTKKEKYASNLWQQRWGFLTRVQEMQEEEAQRIGMSLNEYRAAVRSVSCKPEQEISVEVDPSPSPLPQTSSAMIGRRARCGLEKYGPVVQTTRNYPIKPPLSPGQIYDPYKQSILFLGSVEGDPISYNLPQSRCEVTDEMWARTQQLTITQFQLDRF